MPGIKTGSSLHRMISNPRATPWGKVLTQLLQSTMEKDPRPEVVLAVVERCLKNFNALHCALVLSRCVDLVRQSAMQAWHASTLAV